MKNHEVNQCPHLHPKRDGKGYVCNDCGILIQLIKTSEIFTPIDRVKILEDLLYDVRSVPYLLASCQKGQMYCRCQKCVNERIDNALGLGGK